jgi:hypothetical protein
MMAAIAIASTGIASPAAASPRLAAWSCNYGDFCIYEHLNGSGLSWAWAGNDGDYRNNSNSGVTADNRATAIRNNGAPATYDGVFYYQNPAWGGDRGCLPRGSSISNLTSKPASGGNWNDKISSHQWTSAC